MKCRQPGSREGKNLENQEQSYFFRLPRELRDIVYHHVLIVPAHIHLTYFRLDNPKGWRFRSFLCHREPAQLERLQNGEHYFHNQVAHPDCLLGAPVTWDVLGSPSNSPWKTRPNTSVLVLLQSCRRIYSETIDMLYKQNTFYLEDPKTLVDLKSQMPEYQLSSFRHLYLQGPGCWGPNSSRRLEHWTKVLAALETLDGLESLCVIIETKCSPPCDYDVLDALNNTKAKLPSNLRVITFHTPGPEVVLSEEEMERQRSQIAFYTTYDELARMPLPDEDDPDL